MTISENLLKNKLLYLGLSIAVGALGFGGNGYYNDMNQEELDIVFIETTVDLGIAKHEAYATPHSSYDVKFDMLTDLVKTNAETDKEIITKMNENHNEQICKIQQVKDLHYNIPETDCS